MAEKTITMEEKPKDKIYVGACVTRDVHGKLVELGKRRELGISDIVREAVREYLAKQETVKEARHE